MQSLYGRQSVYCRKPARVAATERLAILSAVGCGLVVTAAFIFAPRLLGQAGIWLALSASEVMTSLCVIGYYICRRRKA